MNTTQEYWDQLHQAERDRRIAYFERTARHAYSHCCSILIGCARQPTSQAASGTGVLIRLEQHEYVVTAKHVVDELAVRRSRGPAHFQVGRLVLDDPRSRLAYEDEEADLAVIAIDPRELSYLSTVPYEPTCPWPPAQPREGDFVQLVGFAAANRKNAPQGTIENYSLHLFGQVMTGATGRFFARIDRTGIPTENVSMLPPPGTHLGGMSGGPVFLYFDEPLPLVGIISQMSCLMDAIGVTPLSAVRIPARTTVVSVGPGS